MNDFRTVQGFEEVWRPVAPPRRRPEAVLAPARPADVRARLLRVVRKAPEVMVKVTGRTRDGGHLRAHLDYITRRGALDLEGPDGMPLSGRALVRDLADDWAAAAELDRGSRAGAPLSLSLMLSMPAGTDPYAVRDAARAFGAAAFGEVFDYGLVLHTDAAHPHVHMSIRRLGWDGSRLNPKKADLEVWRQLFAQALRDRGVEAEATPRRARGVTRKAERQPVRKIRERAEAGHGAAPRVRRSAFQDAARAAFAGETAPTSWEVRSLDRQRRTRAFYREQAELLIRSENPEDRELGHAIKVFVQNMPAPDSQRLAMARQLREANRHLSRTASGPDRERPR